MDNNQKWDVSQTNDFILPFVLDFQEQNFDILTGNDNKPIIAFHLSSTVCEDSSVSQSLDIKTDSRGIEVLNGLCNQVRHFRRILFLPWTWHGAKFRYFRELILFYMESTRFTVSHANIEFTWTGIWRIWQWRSSGGNSGHEETWSTSNLSQSEAISNLSNPMENPKPSRNPRREVWWVDLGATNHSLKSIGRCFEDRLNWSVLSSSNSLLHHVRSPKDINLRRNLHQCPGYLREEIALACDLSKSTIISHTFEDFAPVVGIDPFTPNIGVNSSNRMRKFAMSFGEKLFFFLH